MTFYYFYIFFVGGHLIIDIMLCCRGNATIVPEFPSKLDWLNTAPLQLRRVKTMFVNMGPCSYFTDFCYLVCPFWFSLAYACKAN